MIPQARPERVALAYSCVYFFCVLAAYYAARPVRDQLIAAVGATQLPWFYGATFVATLVLTPTFAVVVARWPRRVAVPAVYGFFIACLLAFVPLFANEGLLSPRALGTVFFVWISVFNLFVVSVFWVVMSDIWTQEQSRRLFPLIAVAGTAGAVCGPLLTRELVDVIGVAPLLAVSAALLAVAVWCVIRLGQWSEREGSRRGSAREGRPVGGGMFEGVKQVFATPFVRNMALLLLLADGIGTVNYALVVDYSGSAFANAVDRTRFAANVDLAANLLTVLLQVLVTRWLLPRGGPSAMLALWAACVMGALIFVAVSNDPYAPVVAGFPAVAIAVIVGRGFAYGLAEPARHSLFAQVSRNERYKGQNMVDTAVWRFGDLIIALGMNGLRGVGVGVTGFAGLAAVSAAAAGLVGWRAARRAAARPDPPGR
ncbi:MFS transporter [Lysobacter bugurensis]|uniref:MFS transporter n=1 Tax=Cognatilysobacter bugurensis TaxID=543356 RepID=A0A918T045_9GAMM|nr:MFS transporter [Lysobacter bugurensis]